MTYLLEFGKTQGVIMIENTPEKIEADNFDDAKKKVKELVIPIIGTGDLIQDDDKKLHFKYVNGNLTSWLFMENNPII